MRSATTTHRSPVFNRRVFYYCTPMNLSSFHATPPAMTVAESIFSMSLLMEVTPHSCSMVLAMSFITVAKHRVSRSRPGTTHCAHASGLRSVAFNAGQSLDSDSSSSSALTQAAHTVCRESQVG
jgi:hypothetical protein